MKIKFHLNRFEKQLHFQLVEIDDGLYGLGFLDKVNDVCVVNTNDWSKSFIFHHPLIATRWRNDNNTLYLNLIESMLNIKIISFSTNEIRDIWYDRLIKAFSNSFKIDDETGKNSWVTPGSD